MKSTITICDTEQIRKPEIVEYDGLLSDWIFSHYDGFDVPTKIYAGGLSECFLIAEFNEDSEPSDDEFIRLNLHHEKVFIIQYPLGLFEGITLLSILQSAAISAAISIVVSALVPRPELANGTRAAKNSPNNAVGPQRNIARAFERVPDCYGEERCVPDLTSPGSFEFINHIKYITQDMCVSHGYGVIEDIRNGETPFSSIVGSSIEIFEPGEFPSLALKEQQSNDVKALTLNPPNDSGLILDIDQFVYYVPSSDYGAIAARTDIFAGFSAGSSAGLSDVFYNESSSLDGNYTINDIVSTNLSLVSARYSYDGNSKELEIYGNFSSFSSKKVVSIDFLVLSPTDREILWSTIISASSSKIALSIDSSALDSSGYMYNIELSLTELTLLNASSVNSEWSGAVEPSKILQVGERVYNPRIQAAGEAVPVGPFVVPGDNNSEVWLDIQFPRGLVVDGNKSYQVGVKWVFEEIDENDIPTGTAFNVVENFIDATVDPRFYTRKVTSDDGVTPGSKYRVTAERTTDTDLDDLTLSDQCQWTRMSGIENITKPDTTGTTRIQVLTQATEQTSSLQESQINLRWTRKCLTYDGVNVIGDLSTGAGLVASRRMADNFITYAFDPLNGNRNANNVDLDAIYAIQDELDSVFNGEKGEFSFTFANKNEPVINEMRQIANACRCFITQAGSTISMVRDQDQAFPKQLFNRRNKIPFTDKKSYITNLPLDNDGVEIEYKDRNDDKTKTIKIPDDLLSDDPNFGNTAIKYLQIQAVGMRNTNQAWDRAQYEYNKLLYKRRIVETSVTNEGLFLELNSRIEITDSTRPSSGSDGEVLGFNGLDVDTSERFIAEEGKNYSVIFRNEDGTVTNAIPVTARVDTEFGFTLSSSVELYLRGLNDYQLGSLYNVAPDDAQSSSYLVQSITPSDVGEVALELINYDSRYYQADNQPAPDERNAYSDGYSNAYG